jgi:polar amino acid transport system substrate-binding protein
LRSFSTTTHAFLIALVAAIGLAVPAAAQTPPQTQPRNDMVPDAWRGDVLRTKPDMHGLDKLRFVTDSDYPPFHYFDEEGVLTGFNVDLAKAICEALEVQCDVRPVEWEDLFAALDKDEADAAIASIRIDADTLEKADLTDRYYATPARFIARKDSELTDIRPETVGGKKIAVVKGTGHEAFVRLYFPEAVIVSFDSAEDAQNSLKSGEVDLMFGDGIGLTFWLNGVTSNSCCEFRGGPYLDSRFFGEGVGIAVKKGNRKLVDILNYGLEQVHASGRFEGLFLRYFPMNFF